MQSAQPKIQKMCEEESDDAEAVAKLLEINDSIHRTIARYKLVKQGNHEAAKNIPQGTLGTTTGVGKNKNNELSLLDFGDEPESTPAPEENGAGATSTGQTQGGHSLEDDLLGLSFNDSNYGQTGGIALGVGQNMGKCNRSTNVDLLLTEFKEYRGLHSSPRLLRLHHKLPSLGLQHLKHLHKPNPSNLTTQPFPHSLHLNPLRATLLLLPLTHRKARLQHPFHHTHNPPRSRPSIPLPL